MDEDATDANVVGALRRHGVDTLTPVDVTTVRALDEAQLEFANNWQRALYSHNISDFCRIHREWMSAGKSHHGIILFQQQRYSVREEVRRLLFLINTKSGEQMRDSLEFLGSWE